MRSQNVTYLVGLDHLRAFAALLIVFYHGLHVLSLWPRAINGNVQPLWWITLNPLAALVEEGHTSVALFMVLSGFVFSVGALGKRVEYRAYLKNRLLRIYPLFLFMVMVGVAAFPGQYSFLAIAQTLLFQSDFMAFNAGPFTTMFWALGVEMQFYLLFPVLHHFIEHEGKRWACAGIVLCVIMRLLAVETGGVSAREVSYWHLLGRLDQFLIGMLSARLYRHLAPRALPWGLLSLLGVALMLAVIVAFNQAGGWTTSPLWKVAWPTLEALTWSAVLVPYAHFAQRIPALISNPLAALGSISYSIYLLHYTCIQIMPRHVTLKLSDDPNIASQLYVAIVVLPVVLALATLTYYTVERPFLRLRVRYVRESIRAASTPPASGERHAASTGRRERA